MSTTNGWIGVDLDGTLAQYDRWRGVAHVGAPVPEMVRRVKAWRAAGVEVRIFTARVASLSPDDYADVVGPINFWCLQNLGEVLPVTNVKDMRMVELWDDRAVQVEPNTGRRMDGQP